MQGVKSDVSNGQLFLSTIKNTTSQNFSALLLPVGDPPRALLRPIPTSPGNLNREYVSCLTEWRNRHVNSFLSIFDATEERTANWLTSSVHPNTGKILFMVTDLNSKCLGHIGLGFIDWESHYGEADGIVSGGESPPGVMRAALKCLLEWARNTLGLRELAVRVRSDNSALAFYRKCGFQEFKRVPLHKTLSDDGAILWVPDESEQDEGISLVHMRYTGEINAGELP